MAAAPDLTAEFKTFLDGLAPAELDALGVGLLLTSGLIAGADGKGSMLESLAIGHSLLDGQRALGPAFMDKLMPAARRGIDAVDLEIVASKERLLQARADEKAGKPLDPGTQAWLAEISQPLGLVLPQFDRARAVHDRMSEPLKVAFDDHVAHLLLRVAEASGRVLWWGEKINEDERMVARAVIARFGVEIRDPYIRAKFKLD